jgi:hypothetical protein
MTYEKLFPVFFGFVFVLFAVGMLFNGYMAYRCVESNDPTSVACFMISEKSSVSIQEPARFAR